MDDHHLVDYIKGCIMVSCHACLGARIIARMGKPELWCGFSEANQRASLIGRSEMSSSRCCRAIVCVNNWISFLLC